MNHHREIAEKLEAAELEIELLRGPEGGGRRYLVERIASLEQELAEAKSGLLAQQYDYAESIKSLEQEIRAMRQDHGAEHADLFARNRALERELACMKAHYEGMKKEREHYFDRSTALEHERDALRAVLVKLVSACTPSPATLDEVAGRAVPRGVRMPEKEVVEEARAFTKREGE